MLLLPPPSKSILSLIGELPEKKRKILIAALGQDDDGLDVFADDWVYKMRREQFAPRGSDWDAWYVNAGRGFGKTLCGAFAVNERVDAKINGRIALVGPTAADVRDIMVEGPSGILATANADNRPDYQPSLRKVTWPNGAEAHCYSAEEPERLRGPQHDFGWCDEIAAWKNLENTWDMYQFGLRLGDHPQTVITTTPKPLKFLKKIRDAKSTIVTRGSTYDNAANLAPNFLKQMKEKYEGTRLGRQELFAEDMEEAEGALWDRDMIERTRREDYPNLVRIIVAIDPSTTSDKTSDECGLVVAGKDAAGHGYMLEDLTERMSPERTIKRALDAYHLWGADRIVAEVNNGGDWIETVLRNKDKYVSYKKLHASRGKMARAEPVVSLYEQNRCHHVGAFPELEDELCSWEPDSGDASPNRLDAIVWAFTELMLTGQQMQMVKVRA